jgi:hypothetical protein
VDHGHGDKGHIVVQHAITLKLSGLSLGYQTIVIAYSGNSKFKAVSTSARSLITG